MVSTAPKSAAKSRRCRVHRAFDRCAGDGAVPGRISSWSVTGSGRRFFAGCFGIFGHGNVAGLGQALLQAELDAVEAGTDPGAAVRAGPQRAGHGAHAPSAYARQRDRLQAWAVTASRRPGVDQHAHRRCAGHDQPAACAAAARGHVRHPRVRAGAAGTRTAVASGDVTVNDAFKPLSRYFDRVWRPEQLPAALLGAMRVLTDPVETGAATIAIPQDVQAEAHDWPESLFSPRTWHVARPVPERLVIERAAEVIASARRPLIVAGGGVIYSGATDALAAFCAQTGIPVGQSQAGKGALVFDHPQSVGAIGSTGTTAANTLASEADVIIGIGTRYSDFTTASRTAFTNPQVRFVNINVASIDRSNTPACRWWPMPAKPWTHWRSHSATTPSRMPTGRGSRSWMRCGKPPSTRCTRWRIRVWG